MCGIFCEQYLFRLNAVDKKKYCGILNLPKHLSVKLARESITILLSVRKFRLYSLGTLSSNTTEDCLLKPHKNLSKQSISNH